MIHLSNMLHKALQPYWAPIIAAGLVIAMLLTCWITFAQPVWVKRHPWLASLCKIKPVWLLVRVMGMVLAVLALTGVGKGVLPDSLYAKDDGVLFDLLPVLLANLLCGLFFSPLLMEFGLLEFVGVPMNRDRKSVV